jgi:hypothetical protein
VDEAKDAIENHQNPVKVVSAAPVKLAPVAKVAVVVS